MVFFGCSCLTVLVVVPSGSSLGIILLDERFAPLFLEKVDGDAARTCFVLVWLGGLYVIGLVPTLLALHVTSPSVVVDES